MAAGRLLENYPRSRETSQNNKENQPRKKLGVILNWFFKDDIYMSIDDPRVGTVDAEGNVLVPVDDEGRILPGKLNIWLFEKVAFFFRRRRRQKKLKCSYNICYSSTNSFLFFTFKF